MVEPLLSGIVIGSVIITVGGLFTTAYLQWVRGSESIDF